MDRPASLDLVSDPDLRPLIGATVLALGKPEGVQLDGGGLAIRYQRTGCAPETILLAFNELGFWVEPDLGD
jgi:hypothetical protein